MTQVVPTINSTTQFKNSLLQVEPLPSSLPGKINYAPSKAKQEANGGGGNSEDKNKNDEDLFNHLQAVLKFGRCLGIIPISGVWETNSENLKFRWSSYPALTNMAISIFLALNSILGFYDVFKSYSGNENANILVLAWDAQTPVFYLIGVVSYTMFLSRSKYVLELFVHWKKISTDLVFTKSDDMGKKHIQWIMTFVLVSCTVKDALNHISLFPILPRTSTQLKTEANFTLMETYYFRNHRYWHRNIPFNFALACLLFICHKLALLAWNYLDLIIIVLSRLLYFKFQVLCDRTREKVLSQNLAVFKQRTGISLWTQVRKDHLNLCKLVHAFEAFLSPIIFASFSMNIFSVCMQLNQGLSPPADDDSVFKTIHTTWSLMNLVSRMFLVALAGARVNEFAHEITMCTQKCPTKDYDRELERLERMIAGGPIGLSGLGCFVLRREFLLVIISVCFTFEIVLLQASGVPAAA